MCGIVGVRGGKENTEASILAYLGSYAQQHRGQESAGIISSDGERLYQEVGMGRVREFFTEARLARLPGFMAIGHNRYATTGSPRVCNAQPLVARSAFGEIAIAHNGNLVNTVPVYDALLRAGVVFSSTTDTEIILQLTVHSTEESFAACLVDALKQVEGAYSLVVMNKDELIAVRDPRGFRPLCMGTLPYGGFVFTSETCALDLIEAENVRELMPGEMVHVSQTGIRAFFPFAEEIQQPCFFELVYFSRPDSTVFGENVYLTRKALGRQLAKEAPVFAEVVVPVPDSGVPAAMGYSEESRIPLEFGLTRNHYVGRTFIEPSQNIRHFGVKVKHNPIRCVLKDKNVVLVDDSIVRGTTSKKLVEMVRSAGAREVHVRVSSPPPKEPCLYGIDTPTRGEYIANKYNIEETRRFIGADSLQYLSYEGMLAIAGKTGKNHCTTCWTGKHSIHIF